MKDFEMNDLIEFECCSPTVIAFVGPNGSGKSSLIQRLKVANPHPGDGRYQGRVVLSDTGEFILPIVCADIIAKRIKAEHPEWSLEKCNMDAFYEAEETRQMFSEAKVDFAFETVGSHPSKIDFLTQLKRQGYNVCIVFVSTEDPSINVKRVRQRVLDDGHDVPLDKIISRYYRTMDLLSSYYDIADEIAIFDNSDDGPMHSGHGPKLLLTKGPNGVTYTQLGLNSSWLAKHLRDKLF